MDPRERDSQMYEQEKTTKRIGKRETRQGFDLKPRLCDLFISENHVSVSKKCYFVYKGKLQFRFPATIALSCTENSSSLFAGSCREYLLGEGKQWQTKDGQQGYSSKATGIQNGRCGPTIMAIYCKLASGTMHSGLFESIERLMPCSTYLLAGNLNS